MLKGKKDMKHEYYYQPMNRRKAGYRRYVRWLYGRCAEFPVPLGWTKRASEIFFRRPADHPAIFYGEQFHLSLFRPGDYVHLIPNTFFEEKRSKNIKSAGGRLPASPAMQELMPESRKRASIEFLS